MGKPALQDIDYMNNSHILVVDDNKVNRLMLEKMLATQGHRVTSMENGIQALTYLQEPNNNRVDVILLDILMPEMDGYQLLETIKKDSKLQHLPVIMTSALDELDSVVRCIEIGATDYLTKPVQSTLLRARLNASLAEKHLRDLEQQYLKSLERELEIGREIQAGFLPKEIPQPEGWQIEAYFQAAREVAGDFYDVFEVGQGKLGMLLGDVTDKGVGSALYMALFRSLLRAIVMADNLNSEQVLPGQVVPPEDRVLQAVRLVNSYICKIHDSASYATLFFGILDTASGELCYVNAGHDPPFLLRGSTILRQVKPTGPAVGIFEDTSYRIDSLVFEAGDTLILYSDGIPDALNIREERFGIERFRSLLQQPDAHSTGIFTALVDALDCHLNGTKQFDDITLLVVSRML